MAINKNHEFEELDGIKCGIVEKNVSADRAQFLKTILEQNNYTVVIVAAAPPKAKAAPKTDENTETPAPAEPEAAPTSFTIGVSDYTFNPINALYGRQLKNSKGQIISPAYWYQQQSTIDEDTPYFQTH